MTNLTTEPLLACLNICQVIFFLLIRTEAGNITIKHKVPYWVNYVTDVLTYYQTHQLTRSITRFAQHTDRLRFMLCFACVTKCL